MLGAYRVAGVLGEGASGIVYRATAPNGQELAVKVLRPELALSERERQRFLDEAERLRRVRHPALVEVIDAGVLPDGLPFIAMPYLHGASLADRLQRGPVPFDVALHLFEELADALHTLHAVGLVHRDIKPENIFVVDGDRHAMLLDLGIARDVTAAPSTTTHAGMIRGTPAYMAPERFFGAPATPATDIYELGVVLYLTLVGSLPWARFDDPTERMRPATPAARGVVLPPRLATTIMQALAVSPSERPTSAHAFATAVQEALSPESAQQIAGGATAFFPGQAPPDSPIHAPAAYAPTVQASVSGVRAAASPTTKRGNGLLFAATTGASLFAAGLGVLLFVVVPMRHRPHKSMARSTDIVLPPAASPSANLTPEPTAPLPPLTQPSESLAQNDDVKHPTEKPKPLPANPIATGGTFADNRDVGKDKPKDDARKEPPAIPRPPAPATFSNGTDCSRLIGYVCSDEYTRIETEADCQEWTLAQANARATANHTIEGLCAAELRQRVRVWRASTAK